MITGSGDAQFNTEPHLMHSIYAVYTALLLRRSVLPLCACNRYTVSLRQQKHPILRHLRHLVLIHCTLHKALPSTHAAKQPHSLLAQGPQLEQLQSISMGLLVAKVGVLHLVLWHPLTSHLLARVRFWRVLTGISALSYTRWAWPDTLPASQWLRIQC